MGHDWTVASNDSDGHHRVSRHKEKKNVKVDRLLVSETQYRFLLLFNSCHLSFIIIIKIINIQSIYIWKKQIQIEIVRIKEFH